MKKIIAFTLAMMLIAIVAVSACAKQEHYHTYHTESTKVVKPHYVTIETKTRMTDKGEVKDVYEVHWRETLVHQVCNAPFCSVSRDFIWKEILARVYLRTIQ